MTEKSIQNEDIASDIRSRLSQALTKLTNQLQAPLKPKNAEAEDIKIHSVPQAESKSACTQVLTAEDLNGLQKCLFDWADSYDHKDWERLARNIAPEIDLDYTALGMQHFPNIKAADFIANVSSPTFLGNPTLMCQHLMGVSYWEVVGLNEVTGRHQIRAAHQVYTDTTLKEVKLKGHAHASNVHKYKKIDGVWKLAGVKPTIIWSEFDFDKVFEH
jgi:scytalone dehydratase